MVDVAFTVFRLVDGDQALDGQVADLIEAQWAHGHDLLSAVRIFSRATTFRSFKILK